MLNPSKLLKRKLGRIDFHATTLGLGGQGTIQKTPSGVDPVSIIIKAYELGINYFDTSNMYEKSQLHFGAAFRQLGLVPGQANYSEEKREAIFINSKTCLRFANRDTFVEDIYYRTNNTYGSGSIDDLKRSMTQIFGDGKGYYPKEAYIDMFMMHSIDTKEDVDALYEGYDNKHPSARVGTFAALRDYRDGTNFTGFNPDHEKLIRYIGFSGHLSPEIMMYMIQKDEHNALDGMLVAINPNDKLYFTMQNNVIPVAKAKNIAVIGMKVFSNGTMYGRLPTFPWTPEENICTIGDATLPSHLPIQYALTTPGVDIVIVGIGYCSDDNTKCQLYQNLLAAQVTPDALTAEQRHEIEDITKHIQNGQTNYFQSAARALSAPQRLQSKVTPTDEGRKVCLQWHTAFAAGAPLKQYEIWRDGKKIAEIPHQPQTGMEPFTFEDHLHDTAMHEYRIVSVDAENHVASSERMLIL